MDSPLVSVILATYNGSQYISEAIESVLAQDYSDLELIIIDDASSDTRIRDILQKYAMRDTRVRTFRNEKNMERSWSKNFGVSEAKGAYIAFIDDDDIWQPSKLEKQISVFQQDATLGLVGTFASYIDEVGGHIGESEHLHVTSKKIHDTMLFSNQFIHSSVMLKKDIFLEAG